MISQTITRLLLRSQATSSEGLQTQVADTGHSTTNLYKKKSQKISHSEENEECDDTEHQTLQLEKPGLLNSASFLGEQDRRFVTLIPTYLWCSHFNSSPTFVWQSIIVVPRHQNLSWCEIPLNQAAARREIATSAPIKFSMFRPSMTNHPPLKIEVESRKQRRLRQSVWNERVRRMKQH